MKKNSYVILSLVLVFSILAILSFVAASKTKYDASTTGVKTYCGDGIANGNEQCDGNDLRYVVCKDIEGFLSGLLYCHPPGTSNECTFDVKYCSANPLPVDG